MAYQRHWAGCALVFVDLIDFDFVVRVAAVGRAIHGGEVCADPNTHKQRTEAISAHGVVLLQWKVLQLEVHHTQPLALYTTCDFV